MQVEQVDFVTVPTRDVDRARAFYGGTLGLRENDQHEFEAGNTWLSLWQPEREQVQFQANTAGIALRVADVGDARKELEDAGVAFKGETVDTGVCHMAFFTDPDGNWLILHRRYATSG